MIRHLAYFEALGSMGENSADWRRVFAGLVVLRLIDIAGPGEPFEYTADSATLHSVRAAIGALSESDVTKPILSEIVDEVASDRIDGAKIGERLLAYGRALDLESKWRLAADVFQTVAALGSTEAPLAIDANILLGGSARRAGDWDTSADGYARAAHAAAVIGDSPRALKAEIGMANTHLAHGNLPAADELLDTVIQEAKTHNLEEILELALHDRSGVAHKKGDYAQALDFAYDALRIAPSGTERDALLEDIAAAFAELGMRDAARDAHLIVSVTSQSQAIVNRAKLNLMELAGLDGMECAFDDYARDLAVAPMDTPLRAYYLLYLGQGQQRFGRMDAAAHSLEEAKRFATSNGLNQIAFETDQAISVLARDWATWPTNVGSPAKADVPDSVRRIARELTQMRELANA